MSPRPPRVSRAEIVRAATALLDAEGPDAFSMRKLAQALDVDAMTVYHHLPHKAALFDAVVDELWGSVATPASEPGTPWRTIVAETARGLRGALLNHPRLVTLVGTRPAVTPRLLDLTDVTLGRLADAGLPPADAMALLDCVVGYVIGKTHGELRMPVGGADVTSEQAVAGLSADTHPHLVAAVAGGYGWAPDEEFERGLGALLAGWGR